MDSLRTIKGEPVPVSQTLSKSSISIVREAKRGELMRREVSWVLFREFLHEVCWEIFISCGDDQEETDDTALQTEDKTSQHYLGVDIWED